MRRAYCTTGTGQWLLPNHEANTGLPRLNARVDHLLEEALGLPTDERSALVVALLDSLEGTDDAAVSDAWRTEVK